MELTSMANMAAPTDGFADISTGAFYANFMEESSTFFDAPILSILNFPPQWMSEDHGAKYPNGENVYRE
jgi:hypothetical protein